MDQIVHRVLQFDRFELDLTRGYLRMNGRDVELPPKPFEVLRHLAENAGRLVSKEELYEVVWPNVTVTDDSLVQCIRELRRKLGDDDHKLVKTIPRRGYLLDVPVSRSDLTTEETSSATKTSIRAKILPTAEEAPSKCATALSMDVKQSLQPVAQRDHPGAVSDMLAYITSRVTEAGSDLDGAVRQQPHTLVAAIALVALFLFLGGGWALQSWLRAEGSTRLTMMAVPTLSVEPLETTADEHRAHATLLGEQITQQLSRSPGGFELSVQAAVPASGTGTVSAAPTRYILRGRVIGSPTNREVIVHLAERQTNREFWFDTVAIRDDTALPVVASQIARTAAVYIRLTESRRPLPARPEAGHYALLGRVLLESERGPEMNRRAMAMFDKAIALDAKHSYSLQGYARTRVAAVGNGWAPADQWLSLLDEAQRAVDAAIEVNQRSVGVHLLRGVIERIKGNPERSLASLEHARQFNPGYPLIHAEIGRTKIDLGRSSEALSDIARALELSPMDEVGAIWLYWAGISAAHLGDDEAVLQWMNKALQRNRAYKEPLLWLSIAHARRGEGSKASEHIDEYMRQVPDFSLPRWLRLLPTNNSEVTRQRLQFARVLQQLGVAEHPNSMAGR